MLSPAQITSPSSTSRPVSSRTSRLPASVSVSPNSTLPPGTAHRPLPGSRPRFTSRTRPLATTATPTPGTGRSTGAWVTAPPVRGVVVVVHDDGAGGEAACLEEVLGEAMPRQDVGVELRDAATPEHLHHPVAEDLGHPDLASFVLGVDQPDGPDEGVRRLRKQRLDAGVQEAEGDSLDLPDEHLGVLALYRLLERGFDGFRQAVGDRPHGMEGRHLRFQPPIQGHEQGNVDYFCGSGDYLH